jgi:DNA-directed RNA polymerase
MNLCKNKNSSYLTILNQEVIDNLNYLQQVPYRINVELLDYINKNTLDIQKNIFRHVNREEFESEIKMLTNEVNEIYELASKGVKNASKIKLNKESSVKAAELLTKKNKLTALLTQFDKFHGILNVANELSVYKSIYFVLQLDFRGRIYTVSDFLNYQGGDLARSLVTLQKKCKFNLY